MNGEWKIENRKLQVLGTAVSVHTRGVRPS